MQAITWIDNLHPRAMPDRRKLKPRKEPSQERSRQTVEAILQATAYILVEDGYQALTTNRRESGSVRIRSTTWASWSMVSPPGADHERHWAP